MIWRILSRSFIVILVLIILLIAFLFTPTGFRLGFYLGTQLVPGQVHYHRVEGMLTGPAYIDHLTYDHNKTHIAIDQLHIDWSLLALANHKIHLRALNAAGITYITPKTQSTEPTPTESTHQPINLGEILKNIKLNRLSIPLDIQIDNAIITDIKYGYSQDDLRAYIKSVTFNGIISNEKINFQAKAEIIKPQHLMLTAEMHGSVKQYDLALQIQNDQFASHLAGTGTDHSIKLNIDNTHLLGGNLSGSVDLNWYPNLSWNIDLIGDQLDIATIQQLMLEIPAKSDPDAPARPKTISFNISSQGNDQQAIVTIHSLQLLKGVVKGQLQATLANPLQSLQWSLQLSGDQLDLNAALPLLPADNPIRQQINADGDFPVSFQLSANGQGSDLTLNLQSLKILNGDVEGTVTTNIENPNNLTAHLKAQNLDINALLKLLSTHNSLAQQLNPEGKFIVSFDIAGQRKDDQINVTIQSLNLLHGSVKGKLEANLKDPMPWQLELSGDHIDLSDVNELIPNMINLNETQAANHLINFNIQGKGTKNKINLSINHTKIFRGSLDGSIKAVLSPQLQWDINLNAQKLDLQPLSNFLPNDINAAIKTKGQLTDKKDPLFDFTGKITAKNAAINVQASHHQIWKGKWDINIPDLNTIIPNAKGRIVSKGTLHGQLQKPETQGNIDITKVKYSTLSIKSITGKWNVYLDQNKSSFIHFLISHVKFGSTTIPEVSIKADGLMTKHDIKANIKLKKDHIKFAANGSFDGLHWIGKITQLAYSDQVLGPWHLSKPADASFSANKATLSNTCIVSGKQGQLCLGGSWSADSPWQFYLKSHGIRLRHLANTAGIALTLSSSLTVDASASGVGTDLQKARIFVELYPGVLQYLVDTKLVDTKIRTSKLTVNIDKDKGLQGNIDFETDAQDHIKGNVSIPQFLDHNIAFDAKSLAAKLRLKIHDFRFVTIFESVLKISLGEMRGNLEANGTLGKPKLSGSAVINLPNFEYTTIDLKAQNIVAHIKGNNEKITFDAKGYTLNKKPVTLTGDTDFTGPDVITKFVIKCEDALVIYNNQMKIYATAVMNFLLKPKILDIDGKILLPRAMLTPKGFGTGEKTVPSGDIEYIGLPKNAQPTNTGHQIHLKLDITLGKNVLLRVYGLRANLEGNLKMLMSPTTATLGDGQVRIENGTFQAYGQYLVIQKGSAISYTNSPIENPALDVRAYKYVSVTEQQIGGETPSTEIKVGVHVYGTPTHMKFGLWSQPPNISQADILSYLILGYANNNDNAGSISVLLDAANAVLDAGGGLDRPPGLTDQLKQGLGITELGIRNESILDALGNPVQQQSLFVIGDRISRRIYVQYSYGIIQSTNEFTLQYLISPHWRFQTTAGDESGTGADILYNISTD